MSESFDIKRIAGPNFRYRKTEMAKRKIFREQADNWRSSSENDRMESKSDFLEKILPSKAETLSDFPVSNSYSMIPLNTHGSDWKTWWWRCSKTTKSCRMEMERSPNGWWMSALFKNFMRKIKLKQVLSVFCGYQWWQRFFAVVCREYGPDLRGPVSAR